ncbi:MAG: cyclic-phosphate processing receiver domain-containing protein [Gemmataceae bacterium]
MVLEDNTDRQREMESLLRDRFFTYEHHFFSDPAESARFLEEHLGETILISLDHDMELIPTSDGRVRDPGSGRQVAEMLATKPPTCPIVFHSTNANAVEAMKLILTDAGWGAYSVTPFGNLEWIGKQWLPTVRKAILDAAVPVVDINKNEILTSLGKAPPLPEVIESLRRK